ncbi:MAG: 2,5-diamino-6-(ribosylamino)-4(3H)-pyrimidinone 5'-phosphate reductase [Candidatus Altiarchaeales archaeon HGW-Altiarchaeales-3]|nr:MAG: 2,5-diamino-6-(ribosylamino)-4(3H)-pyrimidinone 5'-phosphate reductase [Candidatus Altiarchaeales archaeon HGW-Altiarchaeales-3]
MKRPYIILNSAMSLDGRIGGKNERIRFSNQQDKERVHKLRTNVDAIMIGINTVLIDDPHLTVKYAKSNKEEDKNPVRIVVDGSLRTPVNARVLNDSAKTIIAVSGSGAEKNKDKIKFLGEKDNIEVIVTESNDNDNNRVNLQNLLEKLYAAGIKKILLEGGGTLNRSMLEGNFVDEIFITVAPVFIGEGVNLIVGNLDKKINLKFMDVLVLEDRVVLHYLVLQ